MNEIEKIVYALDLLEGKRETEADRGISLKEESFILKSDIENMKNFLKKALSQLENFEIEVREKV